MKLGNQNSWWVQVTAENGKVMELPFDTKEEAAEMMESLAKEAEQTNSKLKLFGPK